MIQLREACIHGRWEAHGYSGQLLKANPETCPGGRLLPADTLAPAVYLEQERNDDLRRALGKGRLAPWEQDIERLLNRGDVILDALAVASRSDREAE